MDDFLNPFCWSSHYFSSSAVGLREVLRPRSEATEAAPGTVGLFWSTVKGDLTP